MKTKYPAGLFILGLIGDFFFHYFFLSVPAIILLIIGIWVKPCLYIALALFLIDAVLCIIERLRIKKAMETESDNPGFRAFQEAVNAHGWRKGAELFAERQTAQYEAENENDQDVNTP